MQQISVTIEDSLKARLDAEARDRGIGPADLVRRLLEEHLHATPPPANAYDLAEKLGLIGCGKGLPADLSTNPAHLEGFGE